MPLPAVQVPTSPQTKMHWPLLKLAATIYLPLLVLLSIALFGMLRADVKVRLQKLQAEESGATHNAVQMLSHDFDNAISDLHFLSQSTALQNYAGNGNADEKQLLSAQLLNFMHSKSHYKQARFIDLSGREKIRVYRTNSHVQLMPEKHLQNKSARYYFPDTLKLAAGEIYISPLGLNPEPDTAKTDSLPLLSFGTPVYSALGRKQGILILNFNGQEILDDFSRAMNDKHHAALLNQEGNWISDPNSAQEWGLLSNRNNTFKSLFPLTWQHISAQQQGSLLNRDGLSSFATFYPVTAQQDGRIYYWKVVSLIPAAKLPAMNAMQYPISFALYAISLLLLASFTLFLAANLITRKQMSTAVLTSEAQLKDAQRLAQLGSWQLDLHTQTLAWSDEIFRIFEINPGLWNASYDVFLNAIHPQDRERVNFEYAESVRKRTPYDSEHRLLFADGRIKHVLEHGETFYDTSGHPLRSIGTVQDISERKAAQEALRTSAETARALLNASTESALLLDIDGKVLSINKAGAKHFRKRPEDMVGHDIYALLPAEIAETRKQKVAEVVRTGHSSSFQDEQDGSVIANNLLPIFDVHGKVSHIAIYATDITERLQLHAEETLLHRIDQQALRSSSTPQLLKFVCDELVQLYGYQLAWIGKKSADGTLAIRAQSGEATDHLEDLRRIGVRWDDTPAGRGPAGSCIRSGQMQVFNIADSGFQPWHDAGILLGISSIAGLPLIVRGEVDGALLLYSAMEHDFEDPLILQRLSVITSRLCVALEMAIDQEQLKLLSGALASAGNGIFITDTKGRILWINHAFTQLTGYSSEECLGRSAAILKSGVHNDAYYTALWQTVQQGNNWNGETVERHKNGAYFTVQQNITSIRDENGAITHFISVLDDITSQKKIAAHIQHMAHHDALTDLPNRTLFRDRLRQMLAQAKRDGHSSTLMFIDLDRFKEVNDTLGHHIGDLLLKAVAKRLTACVREVDTVSRLAGDEFTVLLPQLGRRDDAALIAQKITAALAAPFHLDGHEVSIGSSTGMAFYPADAVNDEGLIKCADQAMYQAKEQGRGTYRFYQASTPDENS